MTREGREAHEPGVVLVVAGAGLAGDDVPFHTGAAAGAGVDHVLEQGGHLVGVLRGEGLPVLDVLPVELAAVVVGDGGDDARAHAQALVGEGGVGLRQVEGRDGHGAEADGQFLREVGLKAQHLGTLDDVADAHLVGQAHGAGVAGKGSGPHGAA